METKTETKTVSEKGKVERNLSTKRINPHTSEMNRHKKYVLDQFDGKRKTQKLNGN